MRRQLLNKFIGNFSWIVTGLSVTSCVAAATHPPFDASLTYVRPVSTGDEPVTSMAIGCSRAIYRTGPTLSPSGSLIHNKLQVLAYTQIQRPNVAHARSVSMKLARCVFWQ